MSIGQFPGMGFQNPEKVIATEVIIIGDDGELLVYNPTEAAGDLVDSIAAVDSTDSVGNAIIPHITSYNPTTGQAASLNAAALQFLTGPTGGAGPWTVKSLIELQSNDGLILGFGSGDDNGFVCIYPPSGDTTGTTDIANIIRLIEQFGNVVLTPGQYYVNGPVNLKPFPGASLQCLAGPNLCNIQMVADNAPMLQTAGLSQVVENITFEYATQQGVTDTLSNGWEVGDDSDGSCFDSTFRNLTFIKSYTGWVTNPNVTSVSGIFDCDVDNIRIFGWYNQAINIVGGNAVGAGNTACEFGDIFVHNNEAGPRANTAAAPVTFELIAELIINSMSIQDAEVDASDCLQIVNCGSVTINALHFEALDLGGDDYGFVYCSHDCTVIINSMTIQFCSSNPTTFNSVFRLFGNAGETPSIICNGPNLLNNTIDKLLYWVDFSATGPGGTSAAETQTCIINCVAKDTSTTGTFTGFITGSTLTFTPAPWNYVGTAGQPAFAADWANSGGSGADLAFRSIVTDEVEIIGIILPSAGAGPTVFTLPTGFVPNSTQRFYAGNSVTAVAGYCEVDATTGAVKVAGGIVTGDAYHISGHYSLSI